MTNYTYEEVINPMTNTIEIIHRIEDNAFIPLDPANADYQAYLNKDTLPSNSADPVEKPKK